MCAYRHASSSLSITLQQIANYSGICEQEGRYDNTVLSSRANSENRTNMAKNRS